MEFGELQSILSHGGERSHKAKGTCQGRNRQPAPPAGNEVSDYKLEGILFVHNRFVYYEWKKMKPHVRGSCIIRKSLSFKNHSFVMFIIENILKRLAKRRILKSLMDISF